LTAAPRAKDGSDLFTGRTSLRWRTERRAFWLTLLFAPTMVGIIGFVVRETFTAQEVALFIVLAMVYVTLVRGRLLGTSIRAHERQLPELHDVVVRCARTLGMPMPHVFVREDLFVCITSMGLGPPYALAISSQYLPHFESDELEFLVGSEMAHIAAGHTRITSLFSASGRENPFVALVAGAWMRRTEYTADRVGLLCCGSLDAATRAIFKCSFHPLASRANYVAFADQRRELEADPGLRMGEWLGESPYAVNRLRELKRFYESPLHAEWRDEFAVRRARVARAAEAGDQPEPTSKPKDVGFFQRGLAFVVDSILVLTIVSGAKLLTVDVSPGDVKNYDLVTATNPFVHFLDQMFAHNIQALEGSAQGAAAIFLVFVYSAVLVAMTGRTFGMMVFGIRVVRKDFARVGAGRAVWRYVLAGLSAACVVPLFVGIFSGRMLHDRFSGTRVVRGGTG
jgi:Zn-dependent protease with chaperone function